MNQFKSFWMKVKAFFRRVNLSWKYIFKKASEWTVAVYAVAGLVRMLVAFEGVFSQETKFLSKLLVAIAVLLCVWVLCAIVQVFVVGFRSKKKVLDGQNGKSVYVLYGDLFDSSIVKNSKRFIGFAVNRCFDTIVNDNLVSAKTIHGKAFKKLYEQGSYTPSSLDVAIQAAIKGNPSSIDLLRTQKKEGNLKRYEIGTYANLQIDANLNYLLLGLSYFDDNLNAQTPKSDYVLAIQKLIESFDKEAQGYPVLMPIIGTGKSRVFRDSDR